MNNSSQQPPPPLSREEIAKREIGVTEISPWLAWAMTAVFLLVLLAVPLVQGAYERSISTHQAGQSVWPRSLAIVTSLPGVPESFRRAEGDLWQRTLTANRVL